MLLAGPRAERAAQDKRGMAGVHDLREAGSRQKGSRKYRKRRLRVEPGRLIGGSPSGIDGYPFETYQLLPIKALST